MSELPFRQAIPDDARVAAHATSASPAWLWSSDGSRVLWANPGGAAAFGAAGAAALAARRFDPREPTAAQVARIAGTLPHAGTPRLERLRGFGGGFGRTLLCSCSRLLLDGETRAVLIVAVEAAGPALSLAERVRRLLADEADAIAAFAPDGALLFATAAASAVLGSTTSLAAIGADEIAARAMSAGRAEGATPHASLAIRRLGSGTDTVLAVSLSPRPQEIAPAQTPTAGPSVAPASPEPPAAPAPAAPAEIAVPAETAAPASSSEDGDGRPANTVASLPPLSASPPHDAARESIVPAEPPADTGTPAIPPPESDGPIAERRHPLRFVWQMDPEGRFTLGSDEFTEVIGPRIATALGRPWRDIAAALGLDSDSQVERAIATRDTWSGITVSWPVDGSADRLKVELSGLPIYDRNRAFLGYRGFGVCRDVERINILARLRRNGQALPPAQAPDPTPETPTITETTFGQRPPEARTDAPPRPPFTIIAAAPNVVPFRAAADARPALSPVERNAFRELARQLTARLKGDNDAARPPTPGETEPSGGTVPVSAVDEPTAAQHEPPEFAALAREPDEGSFGTDTVGPLLDRLPIGILVYRFEHLIHANRVFLDWTGYRDLEALAEAGGLDTLFVEPGGSDANEIDGVGRSITIAATSGDRMPVEGRLFSVPWNGEAALVLVLASVDGRRPATEVALRLAEAEAKELRSVVETSSDGIVVVDLDARILSANARADALFGRGSGALVGTRLTELLAADSRGPALQSLDTAARNPAGSAPEQREVAGLAGDDAQVPLQMTIGRIAEDADRFAVILRDITAWKSAERELLADRQRAEKTVADKSEFLAKISHEIRTPLNSIIGFSEVMIDERFGPIGNERYREYLKDIRASGNHVVSLLNDLLDLSKIESGKLELRFTAVQLNDMVQSCVTLMQPHANREHIIIRTSLLPSLPPVLADPRAVRQIVLNLLSNSIKFTAAGGQVIVSTALSDDGDVALRVRDTGIGMSPGDLAAALEPFRQLATAPRGGSIGSGLGLPLTKALAEANHASFAISSKISDGTLVEIAFPAARVVAD